MSIIDLHATVEQVRAVVDRHVRGAMSDAVRIDREYRGTGLRGQLERMDIAAKTAVDYVIEGLGDYSTIWEEGP